MKFLEIKVGKSLNPNTGEEWWKADTLVSLEDGEVPEDVFKAVRKRVDGWLPNPMPPPDTFSPPIKIDPKISRMKLLIDSATTKAQLGNYRFQCPKELEEHLNAKLKQLKK